MYESEMWILPKKQESAMQVTEMNVLRWIAEKRSWIGEQCENSRGAKARGGAGESARSERWDRRD